MSDQNKDDKTEEATEKRKRDAKKKGDVSKSQDVSSTAILFSWLLVVTVSGSFTIDALKDIINTSLDHMNDNFYFIFIDLMHKFNNYFLIITCIYFIPISIICVIVDFIQIGPIFQFEKMQLKFENLNPVSGIKKLFSINNLFNLLKQIIKTLIILSIVYIFISSILPKIPSLVFGSPLEILIVSENATKSIFFWVSLIFCFVALADYFWQQREYKKKLRMSKHEVKREYKEDMGDPYIRQRRVQIQRELAQQNPSNATKNANMLVVNPTRLAIALEYNPELAPAPVVTAKGAGPTAQMMREAATEAGVPIIRQINLAQDLYLRAEIDEIIPDDLFTAVAELMIWIERFGKKAAQNPDGTDPIIFDSINPEDEYHSDNRTTKKGGLDNAD